MSLKKLASALSFAHLLGLPTAAAAAEEDDKEKKDEAARADDDKQREDESDDDYAKRMEEKDKDEQSKAEEDDKKEKDDTDSKKGKRADDDGDDDSMKGAAAERARCAEIMAYGIKNGCARQAGVFAFDTGMTAKQALAALEAGAIDGRRGSSLASRMADTRVPNVGAEGGADGLDTSSPAGKAKAIADQIIAAGMKRRNEKA